MENKEMKIKVIKANKSLLDRNNGGNRKPRVAAYCRVSTDDPEQEESFQNQIDYYSDLISKTKGWDNVGIYADKGITGTSDEKRPQFMKMIKDAMNGKIDIILVKSLSRFSRNVLDTLNYVRSLKEHNISVRFGEEHIDTFTQDGELMLTVLSSVAQQEVQNTAEHVKHGLQMKMSRGELVGFQGCLGYDYDKNTKSMTVNSKEAKIVRFIFKRYLDGAGTTVIARELKEHRYATKRGEYDWHDSTILGIIKNEKYKGDLHEGKTFTLDPISKKRLKNKGESDSFYISNHHEAIISEEDWNEANRILKERSYSRMKGEDGYRNRYVRTHPLSNVIHCGFCDNTLGRRHWKSGHSYDHYVWHCLGYTKHGKETCEHSKGIPESLIMDVFVDAYNRIAGGKKELIQSFLELSKKDQENMGLQERLDSVNDQLKENHKQQERLVKLYMTGSIKNDAYQRQYESIIQEENKLRKDKDNIEYMMTNQSESLKAIAGFETEMKKRGMESIDTFDSKIFDICVQKVLIGGYEVDGTPNPYKIAIIFKQGWDKVMKSLPNLNDFSHSTKVIHAPKGDMKYQELKQYNYFWRHSSFIQKGKRKVKVQSDFIPVSLCIIK